MTFNKRLLTVEDYNSVVEHFGKAVTDYYTFDTRISSREHWYAYDFIEVFYNMSYIQFNIKNNLWTGGFYIKECNLSNYSVSANSNRIIVTGPGIKYVILVLELSTKYSRNKIIEMGFNPVYSPFIRPFYENFQLDIGFVDKNNEPLVDHMFFDVSNDEEVYSDNMGQISVIAPPPIRPGDIDYSINDPSTNMDYYFPFIALKADLPVVITSENIIKDKENIVSFKFLFDDEYNITDNMLFSDNDITLNVNGKSYSINEYSNGSFDFIVDLTDYFGNSVSMELVIGGNAYLNSTTLNFIEDVNYFTTSDINALKDEIEDNTGADTIIFTGEELNISINVNRDVMIEFDKPIINDENNVIPFIVDGNSILTLKKLNYTTTNDANVILLNNGNLICLECNFEYCSNTVINSKKGDVTIDNCVFTNNYSCINTNGNLSLYNSSFNLNDENYVDIGSVAFIKVLTSLSINYCRFNIELTGMSNLGLSYLFFKIGKNCIVNSIKASNLVVNQSFPVKYNTSNLNIQSSRFNIHNSTNKCMVWTVEDTNTVFYNDMVVEYV